MKVTGKPFTQERHERRDPRYTKVPFRRRPVCLSQSNLKVGIDRGLVSPEDHGFLVVRSFPQWRSLLFGTSSLPLS